MSTEIRSVFEGLKPASCYGYYDVKANACSKICKISHICKEATARKKSDNVPPPTPPPQPEKIEPITEPNPVDYFLDLFRGKTKVKQHPKSANIFAVLDKKGRPIMKIATAKNGDGKVMVQSTKGSTVFDLDSLEAAEKAFDSLK